jgi:hypothetical protein
MLRIRTIRYHRDNDVPDWYGRWWVRKPENGHFQVRTDPENPLYDASFHRMIREMGKRYDGNPNLESVDLSIVGAWGEGAGAAELSDATRRALVDSYTESSTELRS